MAVAKAICKCKYCGREFARETTCMNRTKADEWEEWAATHFDECPKCYGARMRKEEESKPLTISVAVSVFPPQILLTASGNTRENKEKLKAAGYRWGYADEGGFLGMLSMNPRMAWQRTISLVDKNLDSEEFKDFLAKEFEQIDKLGAVRKMECTKVDLAMCGQRLSEMQKETAEKLETIKQMELKKPKLPNWVPEGRWNRKIYGSARSGFSIYIDGNKLSISDDQKAELSAWIDENNKIEAEIKKLKNM